MTVDGLIGVVGLVLRIDATEHLLMRRWVVLGERRYSISGVSIAVVLSLA